MSSNEATIITEQAALQLHGFQLLESFTAGGMGEIWKAKQIDPPREVIIKFLPKKYATDDQFRVRFERETLVQGRLGHPNIVPIFAAGETDGSKYFAMEFMGGGSLRQKLDRSRLSPAQALSVTLDVAAALGAAHRAGYVHRDIKPANILFRENSDVALLTDFGIAGEINQASPYTQVLSQIGTPGYMSPEQYKNLPASPTSDIYSLGVVLFEMLTGEKPFAKNASDSAIPKLPSDLNRLQPLIDRMVVADLDQRYSDTAALIKDLKYFQQQLLYQGSTRINKKSKTTVVIGSILFLVIAPGLAIWIYYPDNKPPFPTTNESSVKDPNKLPSPVSISPEAQVTHNKAAEAQKKPLKVQPDSDAEVRRIPGNIMPITPQAFVYYQHALKLRSASVYKRFLSQFKDDALAYVIRVAAGETQVDNVRIKAENGDPSAQFVMAELYENGIGVSQSSEQAKFWAEKAALSKHPLPMSQYALILLQNSTSALEKKKAIDSLKKAAANGLFIAETKLGALLVEDELIEQDLTQALELFSRAADTGDPYAMEYLSQLYNSGLVVKPSDPNRARDLHARALRILEMKE